MTQTDLVAFDGAWSRLEAWVTRHSPADHSALRGPSRGEQIAALDSRLGFALHPELRALLERHDGAAEPAVVTGSRALAPAGVFLPLGHRLSGVNDIAMMYDVLVDVAQENIDSDLWEEDADALAVNLHRCVPLALPNDGGVAFVDHRPGPSYGHVHEMGIGSGDLEGHIGRPA